MMPYQTYQLWEIERAKTTSQQRAADKRRGELAAALSRSFSLAGRHVRAAAAVGPWRRSSARPAEPAPAGRLRTAG